jgi:hypothetical protein
MSDIEAQLPVLARAHAPALIRNGDERAQTRFWEFFVSNIGNPNTRRAYGRAPPSNSSIGWRRAASHAPPLIVCERMGAAVGQLEWWLMKSGPS